jgi:membrane associated rhomboid family serine protease
VGSLWEIFYLSIAVVAAYQAIFLWRRAGRAARPYAMLLLGNAAIATAAYVGGRSGEGGRIAELLGAASVFAFVGLVVVPPILRDLTRRALAREMLGLALWLTRVRETLTPGLGAQGERELIEVIRAVRAGDVDAAIAALKARRAASQDPRERRALDDRLAFTLLAASRWREAAEEFERGRDAGGPASVALAVEMIRAYGELGDLDRAAEIMAWVDQPRAAPEPALAYFVSRARLLFLAYAGKVAAVEAALADGGPLGAMPDAARFYWIGTAMQFAGEHDRGGAALRRAVTLSERDARGRALAEQRLAAPPRDPVVLSAELEDLAARVALASTTAGPAPVPPGRATGAVRATYTIIAANLAVHLVVTFVLGSTQDAWALARAGANLKSVVADEPWRLLSSTFLHVGGLHLLVNMLSLWSLGRFVEPSFGALRFAVVYGLAALAGSLASVLFGAPGMSAGASGAVFGILGAAIAELAIVRRSTAAPGWRRAVLGNLVFVALANLAIGALYPMIDQAAHVGGLVGGGAAALVFSPGWAVGRARATRTVATLLFGALIAATVAAAAAVVATDPAETRERIGWRRHTMGLLSIELPASWEVLSDTTATDPMVPLSPTFTLEVLERDQLAGVVGGIVEALEERDDVADVRALAAPLTPPAGWSAAMVGFTFIDDDGGRATYEKLIFAGVHEWLGPRVAVAVTIFAPAARRDESVAVAPRILGSLRPAGAP